MTQSTASEVIVTPTRQTLAIEGAVTDSGFAELEHHREPGT